MNNNIPINFIDSSWAPKNGEYKKVLILNYDNWNDYGYYTSFNLFYCDDEGKVHEVGSVKIYSKQDDCVKDKLDNTITFLDNKYCSLGQDLSYYRNLKYFLPSEYKNIFKRLNDIAIFPEIKNSFIKEKGVLISLLRFSGAEKALNEATEIINDQYENKNISFAYKVKVPYDFCPVTLVFNFERSEYFPYRINVLIGKNGTGKTQILSKISDSLSGYTDRQEENVFIGRRPPIDKVMSISYSAFDQFKKPPAKQNTFSYVYCGIQSEDGTLSISQLKDNFKISYQKIQERKREGIWKDILSELMETEHQRIIRLMMKNQLGDINWSSGQSILISTITEVIAKIENESIILFDEPEIHLHPNAIANIMRMFYKLLEEFNSYAIFSTHSPIILQEIPSKYIQILDRDENILTVRQPEIECFGNNISDIVSDIFDVNSRESNYKSRLKELSGKMSYNEILNLFDNKLSLNALIFLKNCCSKENI